MQEGPEDIPKQKKQLKGLLLEELEAIVEELGEPRFRATQLFQWMHKRDARNFEEMLNLPKELREKLSDHYYINTLEVTGQEASNAVGTVKFLSKTHGGHLIESVIIPEEKRTTLCLSSQVGCPLDCKFCATGLMGYKMNLTAGEIYDQYLNARRISDQPVTNIVYMGMGEPLLNYEATVNSLRLLLHPEAAGFSPKRITVSTAGIAPRIKDLADTELNIRIALSLHSCFDDIRSKIMPINEKYPLEKNIEALKYYTKRTGKRITFEYTMLKGINDRDEDIKAIVQLMSNIKSKINIIPFNSLAHMDPGGLSGSLESSSTERIEEFAERLRDKDLRVLVRNTQGDDIAAACGQLAVKQ